MAKGENERNQEKVLSGMKLRTVHMKHCEMLLVEFPRRNSLKKNTQYPVLQKKEGLRLMVLVSTVW